MFLSPGIKSKNKSKTNLFEVIIHKGPQENHHIPSNLLPTKGGMGYFKESDFKKTKEPRVRVKIKLLMFYL